MKKRLFKIGMVCLAVMGSVSPFLMTQKAEAQEVSTCEKYCSLNFDYDCTVIFPWGSTARCSYSAFRVELAQ